MRSERARVSLDVLEEMKWELRFEALMTAQAGIMQDALGGRHAHRDERSFVP
jgi:hypothetical protein